MRLSLGRFLLGNKGSVFSLQSPRPVASKGLHRQILLFSSMHSGAVALGADSEACRDRLPVGCSAVGSSAWVSCRVRASLAGQGQHGGRWRSLPRPGRPAGRLLTGRKVNASHVSELGDLFWIPLFGSFAHFSIRSFKTSSVLGRSALCMWPIAHVFSVFLMSVLPFCADPAAAEGVVLLRNGV